MRVFIFISLLLGFPVILYAHDVKMENHLIKNQHLKLIPCVEIEQIAFRDCSLNAINLLLRENSLNEIDNQMLKIGSCEQVVLYIGRLCKQKNFKNIFKYFALPK